MRHHEKYSMAEEEIDDRSVRESDVCANIKNFDRNQPTEEADTDEDSEGYVQMQPCTDPKIPKQSQSSATTRRMSCYKCLAEGLGLLCVFLLAMTTGLYMKHTSEKDQLISSYRRLTAERNQLQAEISAIRGNCESPCPTGWVYFHCNCYYLSSLEKTWVEARETCRSTEADLVTINSREEQVFINKLNKSSWIGLQRAENGWEWVDNTVLSNESWRLLQPDNNTENCVMSIPDLSNSTFAWQGTRCDSNLSFYCEKSAY
ncbi:hypothetical protein ACEWY4_016550 [Coilia grayii]|uniref:C-type lectin domain-containing protein n=1 Tax=Coilia grayii TaxID=363190 RepID=A0ABD1JKN8_9TELE